MGSPAKNETYNYSRFRMSVYELGYFPGPKAGEQVDYGYTLTDLNGNTVKLEDELLSLQRNTMTHSFALQVLGRSLNKIKSAITGRVGH